MKIYVLLFVMIIALQGCQENVSDSGPNIELQLAEFDYFEESIPYEATAYSEIPNHDQVAAIGRLLFYDSRLSQNNSIACASCHLQELGFADGNQVSAGLQNFKTTRNAMALVNNAYQVSHFWEGNLGTIDDHILNPISNHIEMGMRSTAQLVDKLSEIEGYNKLFLQVYDSPIKDSLIEQSLATFVASIVSYNTKFDKGKHINYSNLNIAESNGKDLFFGKAKCNNCHRGNHFAASWRANANIGLDMDYTDQGAENGQFKIPSLRNIALTGPYMHDGRFTTLEEVVDHYVNGVQRHPYLDWILNQPILLSEVEQGELVSFLHTLTDYELISDEKFSDPFD